MLRALVVLVAALALAIWVSPSWTAAERTLSLRVRTGDEIESLLRAGVRELGARAMRMATEQGEEPERAQTTRGDVAAGPPDRESARPSGGARERLTGRDRARLDRLVQEKLNEE